MKKDKNSKLSLKKPSAGNIIKASLAFAAGAACANSAVFGAPSALAAVFALVLSPLPAVFFAAGAAMFAGIFSGFGAVPLISALAAAGAVRLGRGLGGKNNSAGSACMIAITYILAETAREVLNGGGAWEIFRSLIVGIFLGTVAFSALRVSRQLSSVSSVGIIPAAVCTVGAVCAFSSFGTSALSLGGIISGFAVLFMAVRFGAGPASAAAFLCAAGAGIANPSDFTVFALLGIPALICGFTSFGSPVRASAVMLAVMAPTAVIFGVSLRSLAVLADCCIASVIFVISYPALSVKLSEIQIISKKEKKGFETEALKSCLAELSERLYAKSCAPYPEKKPLKEELAAAVCSGCEMSGRCAGDLKDVERARDITDLYRALPECRKIPELQRKSGELKRRGEYAEVKAEECREFARLCSDMLLNACGIIEDVEKISERKGGDGILTLRLERSLKRADIKFIYASVKSSGAAEIAAPMTARANEVKLCTLLGDITGLEYRKPERKRIGETEILKFYPKTKFAVDAGICQLSAKKEASGDVVECFYIGNRYYAILSDGMGRGQHARAVALTLVSVLKELLTAGFSVRTASDIASSVLRASIPEESFATLDLLRIDLDSGLAEIYKAGACVSYAETDGETVRLRAGGYPEGILSRCGLTVQRFNFRKKGYILLMSDGAAGIKPERFKEVIGTENKLPTDEAAALLLGHVGSDNGGQADDISVILVKVERKEL